MPAAAQERAAEVAQKLGLKDPAELILHLPLRYEDETRLTPLADIRPGDPAQIEAVVVHAKVQMRPRRQLVVELAEVRISARGEESHLASISNPPSRLHLRFLHFYPSQVAQLKPGVRLRLFGEVRQGFFGAEMVHPRYRIVREGEPLPEYFTPVYPTVAGLSQTRVRQAIAAALADTDLSDPLPPARLEALGLPSFREAIDTLHRPSPDIPLTCLETRTHPAWQRMKFDELLAQQLSLRLHAAARAQLTAPALSDTAGLSEQLLAQLPFSLTAAQARAFAEIRADLARPHPMHRLLQGDVGSGKTCVAALATLVAVGAGQQAAVMAPTEILAEQLYLKFKEWLTPLGIPIVWLTAALKGRARKAALSDLASGRAAVAVGTHALIQDGVEFANLALAIIDEQHRFGVEQRLALRSKGSAGMPHLLMMSATPIPRSLAMTHYADLEVSVIDEQPPGRTPIATRVIPDSRRDEVIDRLADYCASGAQAYWICPLVEESEKLSLKAAIDTHAELAARLPGLRVGLAHGRLKADEKAAVMAAFKAGEIDLLVATTVVEVGVDVPNAGLMVIEHAERMGLAQLHQLRGRVGRGRRQSSCVLLYATPLSDTARQRLKVIKESQDGFAIARADLAMRGPGELLGARQSGEALLRFANLERDIGLIEAARLLADELLAQDPEAVRRHLARWLPRGMEFMRA